MTRQDVNDALFERDHLSELESLKYCKISSSLVLALPWPYVYRCLFRSLLSRAPASPNVTSPYPMSLKGEHHFNPEDSRPNFGK